MLTLADWISVKSVQQQRLERGMKKHLGGDVDMGDKGHTLEVEDQNIHKWEAEEKVI
jgi:hypothetical protein